MTWLLCDYGEVLSEPQPAAAVEAMARLCGLGVAEFELAYWAPRAAYDRGDLTAAEYWAAVTGADPGDHLGALVDADVDGWLHLDSASLAAVARAVERGMRPAILSNAPREVGLAIDALAELAPYSPRLFSWALGEVKPDPAIYRLALDALGAEASVVVFVDDRPANVVSARAAGLTAVFFTGPDCIDEL